MKANIQDIIKNVYRRAELDWEVKDINGAVFAIKADGTAIAVSNRQAAGRMSRKK